MKPQRKGEKCNTCGKSHHIFDHDLRGKVRFAVCGQAFTWEPEIKQSKKSK